MKVNSTKPLWQIKFDFGLFMLGLLYLNRVKTRLGVCGQLSVVSGLQVLRASFCVSSIVEI